MVPVSVLQHCPGRFRYQDVAEKGNMIARANAALVTTAGGIATSLATVNDYLQAGAYVVSIVAGLLAAYIYWQKIRKGK